MPEMPQAPGEGEVQGKAQLIYPLTELMVHQPPLRVYPSLRKQAKGKKCKTQSTYFCVFGIKRTIEKETE